MSGAKQNENSESMRKRVGKDEEVECALKLWFTHVDGQKKLLFSLDFFLFGYYYQSVNVITFGSAQSDHIKRRLLLYNLISTSDVKILFYFAQD